MKKGKKKKKKKKKNIPDDAVGSLAQLLSDVIALIDDKVLVKHLEDLPSLKICHVARHFALACIYLGRQGKVRRKGDSARQTRQSTNRPETRQASSRSSRRARDAEARCKGGKRTAGIPRASKVGFN